MPNFGDVILLKTCPLTGLITGKIYKPLNPKPMKNQYPKVSPDGKKPPRPIMTTPVLMTACLPANSHETVTPVLKTIL
jgi:hypothetical protein